MEPAVMTQQLATESASKNDVRPAIDAAPRTAPSSLVPQACPTCGVTPASNGAATVAPSYVYAIGRVEPYFPNLSVEKEFAQATGRAATAALTDREALHQVLSQRQNRYLARQLCYVLTIEGLETYILQPRDSLDFELLIDAIRPRPEPTDVDIVIGLRGRIASPEVCNSLMVPIVVFDQLYSFDRASLFKSIPKPEHIPEEKFKAAAEELFDRIMQMTGNAGETAEHRALNYLAVRYHAIYAKAAEEFARNSALSAVDVRISPLSGVRNVEEVIFSYTDRNTDVIEKFSVRVDLTEMFPFLARKLAPYYDR